MYIFKTSNTNTNTGLLVYLNTNTKTYLFPTLVTIEQALPGPPRLSDIPLA